MNEKIGAPRAGPTTCTSRAHILTASGTYDLNQGFVGDIPNIDQEMGLASHGADAYDRKGILLGVQPDRYSDHPPSTTIDESVTKPPRSEAIHSTASAISSGLPRRPTGSRSIAF